MLSPAEFCKLIAVEQKDIVLPASVEGYGLTSGARYKKGRNRLDTADRNNKIRVFWTVLSFLVAIGIALVYNIRIMSFALELEEG